MKDSTLFSILVPVYNVESYLRQCLESIIHQTFHDYEIILVDDGSTDLSGKICDEYQAMYPDLIYVIHKNNEGLLLARREAINIAGGEYFIYVDSDDYVELNLLEQLKKYIDNYKPDLIVFNADKVTDAKSSILYQPLFTRNTLLQEIEKPIYYEATLKHSISNGIWGKAVRRTIVDIGRNYSRFSSVTLGEDLLQCLPYITSAKKIYFANEVLYHYRVTKNSMAHSFSTARYYSLRLVEGTIPSYVKNWNLNNKRNLVAYHALRETVWGTLRALEKSSSTLDETQYKFYADISADSLMRHYYCVVDKRMLNIVQQLVLRSIFSNHYWLLNMELRIMRKFDNFSLRRKK